MFLTQLISYWLAKDDEQLLKESERDNIDLCFTLTSSSFPYEAASLRVRSIGFIPEQECEGLRRKITFARILMLLEYKRDLQYRFPTKCCLVSSKEKNSFPE